MVDKSQPPYPKGQHPNSKDAFYRLHRDLTKQPRTRPPHQTQGLGRVDPKRAETRLKRFD